MPAAPIQFYNRRTQRLETEAVYGEGPLRFVYENPLGKLALHLLVKRAIFSEIYGQRMDDLDSAAKIRPFLETYGVDTSEFAEPVESYRTFNEFFYRRLKPGARPIVADPQAVALPADGRHFVIPDVSLCRDFFVKGVKFHLPALLDDAELAARYEKGAVLISRLCPTDYHRFHFPCGGVAETPRLINGPLYSVSPIAFMKRPSIFWENKRYVTRLQTGQFGEVLLLEVGATCVGSVVHTSPADAPVLKGDEKGYFRFGGSCFITIFEPGRIQFSDDLLQQSAQGREVYARMGDVAGFAIEPRDSSLPSGPAS
ncbi:phosphatidylserine decarboxylase [Prosthecobacter debontii]|uniref:Phosphatidylserine decarboxylase n=1 Tax=Prosthecobacter debontii TaxID=48467 RepID=A0A1T4YHS9_9BACT|nr:phosphatidylserine decarboxylase [Prosthecobacter debontii]SKB01263.1 phosphatidylserine decarboxylase [Prosthecobacter debontii]